MKIANARFSQEAAHRVISSTVRYRCIAASHAGVSGDKVGTIQDCGKERERRFFRRDPPSASSK